MVVYHHNNLFLKLNSDNTVSIFGLGVVKYKDENIYILFYKRRLETCIKRIINGPLDVGLVDTRGLETSLTVPYSVSVVNVVTIILSLIAKKMMMG